MHCYALGEVCTLDSVRRSQGRSRKSCRLLVTLFASSFCFPCRCSCIAHYIPFGRCSIIWGIFCPTSLERLHGVRSPTSELLPPTPLLLERTLLRRYRVEARSNIPLHRPSLFCFSNSCLSLPPPTADLLALTGGDRQFPSRTPR